MATVTVHPRFATLEWTCNEDDEHEGADDQVIVHQDLSDIEDSGTAICPQCGADMELVSVTVDREGEGYSVER